MARRSSRRSSRKRSHTRKHRTSINRRVPDHVGPVSIPDTIRNLCVKCRQKRTVKVSSTFTSYNPRNKVRMVWACGHCNSCGTKVCRPLGAKN